MDRKLFNQCRLHTFTKVKEIVQKDFLFADDCALNAGSEPEMQDSMEKFSTACDNFGLTISTKKSHATASTRLPYVEPSIAVKGCKLPDIDKLKYLSNIISKAVHIDDKVNCRIVKAKCQLWKAM